MKRRITALLLAMCLLAGGAAAFSDVAAGSWYAQAVEQVSQQGWMGGVDGQHFAPDASVTRGTVVTVLYRMEGAPSVNGESGFPDVEGDSWYASAAVWAHSAGIASGYGDGRFGPNDNVTREQLAVFLWRYAQYKGMELAEGILGGFEDSGSVSSWARDGMEHAVGAGLITGTSEGLLKPGGVANRAQLAVILCRMMTPAQG
jgi:hypothetical protein